MKNHGKDAIKYAEPCTLNEIYFQEYFYEHKKALSR